MTQHEQHVRFDCVSVALAGRGATSPTQAAAVVETAAILEAYTLRGCVSVLNPLGNKTPNLHDAVDIGPVGAAGDKAGGERGSDFVDPSVPLSGGGKGVNSHNESPVDGFGSASTVGEAGRVGNDLAGGVHASGELIKLLVSKVRSRAERIRETIGRDRLRIADRQAFSEALDDVANAVEVSGSTLNLEALLQATGEMDSPLLRELLAVSGIGRKWYTAEPLRRAFGLSSQDGANGEADKSDSAQASEGL